MSLLSELQRRRVFKVASIYAVGAWGVIQVASTVFPHLPLPEWSVRLVIVCSVVGLPVACVLAWMFDITPEGIRVTGPETDEAAAPVPRRAASRYVVGAAALLTIGVAALGTYLYAMGYAALQPERVLVAGFENQTGDDRLDPLGRMAADWITQGLTESGMVEVVDARTSLAISSLAAGTRVGVPPLDSLVKGTGAGTVVVGTVYREGDSIRFQARVMDAERGTLLRAVDPVTAAIDAPMPGVELLRQRVLAALATQFDSRLASWQSGVTQPPTYAAYQAYMDGLTEYARGRFRTAVAHFDRAVALDSTFLLNQVWLAQTLSLSYMDVTGLQRADSVFARLAPQRHKLSAYDQAHLDFALAYRNGDVTGGYAAARQMMRAAPGSADAVREAAFTAGWLNRPREAIRLLESLDPENGLLREWGYEYWFILTSAYHMLGEHERELKRAREGRKQHPEDPQVLLTEIRALVALGRVEEVMQRVEEGTPAATDPAGILGFAARELRAHGHEEAAHAMFGRALAGQQTHKPSSPAQRRGAQLSTAGLLYEMGRFREARALYRTVLQEDSVAADSLRIRPGTRVRVEGALGALAAHTGDRNTALAISESLDYSRLSPALRTYFGQYTLHRARIAAALGEKDRAVELLRTALTQGGAAGDDLSWVHTDRELRSLRGYPPFEQLMKPKG